MNIRFQDISLSINNISILENINIDIESGQFVGIIGPNGAGKSSIIRCLYKYYKPCSGNIYIDNNHIDNYDNLDIAKNISVVLQELPTDFGLTVKDVIMMGRIPHQKIFNNTDKIDNSFIKYALKKVNMLKYINTLFQNLSGGEKQRIIIARAFVQEPQILLMDEPTNHLDINNQVSVMKLAKDLKISTVAIIHDLNIASAFCDKIYIIKDKKVFNSGTPEQIFNTESIKNVFDINVYISRCHIDNHNRINIHYL